MAWWPQIFLSGWFYNLLALLLWFQVPRYIQYEMEWQRAFEICCCCCLKVSKWCLRNFDLIWYAEMTWLLIHVILHNEMQWNIIAHLLYTIYHSRMGIEEVIKPSVLETLNPLVGPCAANARNFFIDQMHLWTFCTKKCAKILRFSGSLFALIKIGPSKMAHSSLWQDSML